MKRWYTAVAVEGGAVLLDGRPVRTPARRALSLPTAPLAEAVADEWRAQGETIDPRAMPMTGFANAAIDCVAPDPAAFAGTLAPYAMTDLLCYRAEGPASLVAAQAAAWDPPLAWAAGRYAIRFVVAHGIVHAAQPAETVARLCQAAAHDPFGLAGLQPLVTIGGSLIAALMVAEGAVTPADAFDATHLDELWQASHWGEDAVALAAREARRRDFHAAARFLTLA